MSEPSAVKDAAAEKHKIVITKQDSSVVKGYLRSAMPSVHELGDSHFCFHEVLAEHGVGVDGAPIDVDWSTVKAVFFVSTFEGNRDQETVRFYANGPQVGKIWVEIVFHDGEVIEGCVQNSLRHLKDDGFFLLPSTPGSNNHLIYVNKASIVGYRVLGIRMPEDK